MGALLATVSHLPPRSGLSRPVPRTWSACGGAGAWCARRKQRQLFSRIAYLGLNLLSSCVAGDRREVTPHNRWIKKRHDMVEESRPCPYLALRSWCGSVCPSRPARGCAFSVLSLLNPLHPAEHTFSAIDTGFLSQPSTACRQPLQRGKTCRAPSREGRHSSCRRPPKPAGRPAASNPTSTSGPATQPTLAAHASAGRPSRTKRVRRRS